MEMQTEPEGCNAKILPENSREDTEIIRWKSDHGWEEQVKR